MNPAMIRTSLAWLGAVLMLALWYFSQQPWSERHDTTSEVNWRGTRDYSGTDSPDAPGASFYLGGSSVLLLAAAGIVAMTFAGESADRLPGVIAFGVAILGGVALWRFTIYFNSFSASTLNRFGGSGHYPTDEARLSLYTAIALAVVGAILLILGPAPKESATATSEK